MTKQSTIKNLLVVPIIASAVLLASPAFAAHPVHAGQAEVRNITHKNSLPKIAEDIIGTVTSTSGSFILVTSEDDTEYTVDASHATIMKALETPDTNPDIIEAKDIKVGDAIVVRGVIRDEEI